MRSLKKVWESFKNFRRSPKKWIITVVLAIILIVLSIYSYDKRQKQGIDIRTILDENAISVNGVDRSFREVAFYIAYEEASVNEQALVYNPDNPRQYWNMHVDGIFVRLAARNAAIQMAQHDEFFYQMALKEELSLSKEEEEALQNAQVDFLADLKEDEGFVRLGITEEDIFASMERMILAQKMQEIYANMQNVVVEDYNFSEAEYLKLIENEKINSNEKLWEQLEFGHITLEN